MITCAGSSMRSSINWICRVWDLSALTPPRPGDLVMIHFTLTAPTTRKPAFKLDVLTSSNRVGSAPHCTHPRGHITLCASGDRNVGRSSIAFGLYGDTEPFCRPEYSQHFLHCTGLGTLSELGFGKVSSTAPQNGHVDTS